MTTTEARNNAHTEFYDSLLTKFPKEIKKAEQSVERNTLKMQIVLNIGEVTYLYLGGSKSVSSEEEREFRVTQYTNHMLAMSQYLDSIHLPKEILALAVEYGTALYAQSLGENLNERTSS